MLSALDIESSSSSAYRRPAAEILPSMNHVGEYTENVYVEDDYSNNSVGDSNVVQKERNFHHDINSPATSTSASGKPNTIQISIPISSEATIVPKNSHKSTAEIVPLPWSRFPATLLTACLNNEIPSSCDRRRMVDDVAKYLIDEKKDDSRNSARWAAIKITPKYPNSFTDKIMNMTVGKNGCESLVIQIYNRIQYVKLLRSGQSTKKDKENSDDNNSALKKRKRKMNTKIDEYGCVEYAPMLQEGESNELQDEKKLFLRNQAIAFSRDETKIDRLLEETYSTQRANINNRKVFIHSILAEWPLLCEAKYFLWHSSVLLGKDIDNIFSTNMRNNCSVIDYMKRFCLEIKKKRNGDNQVEEIKKILTDLKTRDQNPLVIATAILPLITLYFEEDVNFLYKIVDVSYFFFR